MTSRTFRQYISQVKRTSPTRHEEAATKTSTTKMWQDKR
jgi:hypothetical protein